MLDITKEQRGNLSDLKKKGFITTFRSDGCDFADFTELGIQFGKELGFPMGS